MTETHVLPTDLAPWEPILADGKNLEFRAILRRCIEAEQGITKIKEILLTYNRKVKEANSVGAIHCAAYIALSEFNEALGIVNPPRPEDRG